MTRQKVDMTKLKNIWAFIMSSNCLDLASWYLLWFNFFLGLKFFAPVWFLFLFVSDYGNELYTKENKD